MFNFASIDAFSNSLAGSQTKTNVGALVSVAAYLLMAYLFWHEFRQFAAVTEVEKLLLDHHDAELIGVALEVLLPRLRCDEVKVVYFNQQTRTDSMEVTANMSLVGHDALGCSVRGSLVLPKVDGLLELGPAMERSAITRGTIDQVLAVNASHAIKRLAFFDPAAAGQALSNLDSGNNDHDVAGLEGVEHISHDKAHQYEYQIKVVPSLNVPLGRPAELSFPYSATFFSKVVADPRQQFGLMVQMNAPGVFLGYSFSSIMLETRQDKRSLLQLVTRVCGVVGGVYAAASLLDQVLYRTTHAKKHD